MNQKQTLLSKGKSPGLGAKSPASMRDFMQRPPPLSGKEGGPTLGLDHLF